MRAFVTHRSWVLRSILFLSVLLVLVGTRAEAQVDPDWDHYKVYRVMNPIPGGPAVILTDQFLSSNHSVLALERFQNPTVKEHGTLVFGINDTTLHYAWWKITDHPFGALVAIDNQFGNQTLQVNRPEFLLNPALKNEQGPPPPG